MTNPSLLLRDLTLLIAMVALALSILHILHPARKMKQEINSISNILEKVREEVDEDNTNVNKSMKNIGKSNQRQGKMIMAIYSSHIPQLQQEISESGESIKMISKAIGNAQKVSHSKERQRYF